MTAARRSSPGDEGRRQAQMFKPGDKVRVLKGKYEGKVMTVRECIGDQVWLAETPRREVQSKGNLEKVEEPK